MSQADVAEAAGIDPRNYGQYERGETDIGLGMLVRLAHVLGTTAEALVAGIGADDVRGVSALPTAARVREARQQQRQPFRRGQRATR